MLLSRPHVWTHLERRVGVFEQLKERLEARPEEVVACECVFEKVRWDLPTNQPSQTGDVRTVGTLGLHRQTQTWATYLRQLRLERLEKRAEERELCVERAVAPTQERDELYTTRQSLPEGHRTHMSTPSATCFHCSSAASDDSCRNTTNASWNSPTSSSQRPSKSRVSSSSSCVLTTAIAAVSASLKRFLEPLRQHRQSTCGRSGTAFARSQSAPYCAAVLWASAAVV